MLSNFSPFILLCKAFQFPVYDLIIFALVAVAFSNPEKGYVWPVTYVV